MYTVNYFRREWISLCNRSKPVPSRPIIIRKTGRSIYPFIRTACVKVFHYPSTRKKTFEWTVEVTRFEFIISRERFFVSVVRPVEGYRSTPRFRIAVHATINVRTVLSTHFIVQRVSTRWARNCGPRGSGDLFLVDPGSSSSFPSVQDSIYVATKGNFHTGVTLSIRHTRWPV